MLSKEERIISEELGLTEAEYRAGATGMRVEGGERRFGGDNVTTGRVAPAQQAAVHPAINGMNVKAGTAHDATGESIGEGAAVRQLLGLRAQAADAEVFAAIKELIRAASAAKAQAAVENALEMGRISVHERDWWKTQLRDEFGVALSVLNERPAGVFTNHNNDPNRGTVDIDNLCRQLHITRAEYDAAAKQG